MVKYSFALANQKGGVGKTSCCVNLAYEFASMGYRVLLVDCDPQGHATLGVGLNPNETKLYVYHLFSEDDADVNITIKDMIVTTNYDNLHIIPSHINNSWIEKLVTAGSEYVIKSNLELIKDYYDIILLDAPPSLGKIVDACLTSATHLLIPVQCEFYAMHGMALLLKTFALIRKRTNPGLQVAGAFANMHDLSTNMSKETVEKIENMFKDRALKTKIPDNIAVAKAQEAGVPVQVFEPKSKAAIAFKELAKEVLDINGK